MDEALQYARERHEEHLTQLLELLRFPSVSTQPEHGSDMVAAATWVAQALENAGLENVRLIETGRHPLVYADWLRAGSDAPTVLIYGHYDVQPPDPLELWDSPPFEPALRDGYVYARGSADDKGQFYIHVKAVESFMRSAGELPVNVKFILEGEEEIGSAGLSAFIPHNRELLAADTVLISDTAMTGKNEPSLVYGLRGNCHVVLTVTGPAHDLHSGSYGGGINNPINALAHMIARLKDETGHILIPGFHDRVRPLDVDERERLALAGLDEAAWLAETGAPAAWGEPEYSLAERIGARPTLDVTGVHGGYAGPGVKTVLPSSATAKISMRLVPDQDPDEVFTALESFVRAIAPPSVTVDLRLYSKSQACIADCETAAVRAAAAAYEATFGRAPILRREGGSIPVVAQFQEHLGAEAVLMGFGLPDDHIHSPNERFYLPNFYSGIETSIRFLSGFADAA